MTQQSDRFLTRVIYGSSLVLGIFLVLLGWLSIRVHKAAKISIEKTVQMEGNLAHVLYLDLVLSGFAQTAITRKEIGWEDRYKAIEPKLNEILTEIFTVLPEVQKEGMILKTEEVSDNLRDREKRAFALLRQGKRKEAQELIFSESYDKQKDVYYEVLGLLAKSLKEYEISLIEKGRKELYRSVFILVIAFPLLFISCFTFYRLLNRWQSALRDSNDRLKILNEALHDLAERLEKVAVTDELTQLPNRRFFNQELAKEVERAKRYDSKFSILVIDLDRFKTVNDSYGHSVGDTVLKNVADHIKSQLRVTDTASRFGGEEFLVLLPNTDTNDAFKLAERIREHIAQQPFKTEEDKKFHITASTGIGEYSKGEKVDALLSRADAALYKAKDKGRNRCELAEVSAQ